MWQALVLAVGSIVVGWVPHAMAQDEDAQVVAEDEEASDPADQEAREAYEAGAVAFDEGRYSVALRFFERAYELSPRPRLLYNVGLSLDRLRRDREALDYFERFLEAEPDSPHRRHVNARIASLREALAERDRVEDAQVVPSDSEVEEEEESSSVFQSWWFWTLAAVLVAGGAATAVILATSSSGVEDPLPGTQGAFFATLTWGP